MNWEGKNVLVTGACGFIGSHLVEYLVHKGANVRAFVYYNSFGNQGWLESVSNETKNAIEIISGDIRAQDSVRNAVNGSETIFHLAALIGIPYSYISPTAYVSTNIQGTLNVMQAALDYDVSKIIQVSTSETYGTAKYTPINEEHPLQPQSPYSATKIGSDAIASSFGKSFDLPVVIARPFNTFGPRQSARAIIPTIISQLLSGKKIIKLGSSVPTRDFTYVKDMVIGMTKLAENDMSIDRIVNIGNGKEISVGDLAMLINNLCKKNVEFQFDSNERLRPKKSEVYRLLCDNSLLFEITNWKPNTSLNEGLKKTIDWFKNNLNNYKADIYNI